MKFDNLIGQAVSEKKLFQYAGNIHVYSLGAGADNPLESNLFHYQHFSVN